MLTFSNSFTLFHPPLFILVALYFVLVLGVIWDLSYRLFSHIFIVKPTLKKLNNSPASASNQGASSSSRGGDQFTPVTYSASAATTRCFNSNTFSNGNVNCEDDGKVFASQSVWISKAIALLFLCLIRLFQLGLLLHWPLLEEDNSLLDTDDTDNGGDEEDLHANLPMIASMPATATGEKLSDLLILKVVSEILNFICWFLLFFLITRIFWIFYGITRQRVSTFRVKRKPSILFSSSSNCFGCSTPGPTSSFNQGIRYLNRSPCSCLSLGLVEVSLALIALGSIGSEVLSHLRLIPHSTWMDYSILRSCQVICLWIIPSFLLLSYGLKVTELMRKWMNLNWPPTRARMQDDAVHNMGATASGSNVTRMIFASDLFSIGNYVHEINKVYIVTLGIFVSTLLRSSIVLYYEFFSYTIVRDIQVPITLIESITGELLTCLLVFSLTRPQFEDRKLLRKVAIANEAISTLSHKDEGSSTLPIFVNGYNGGGGFNGGGYNGINGGYNGGYNGINGGNGGGASSVANLSRISFNSDDPISDRTIPEDHHGLYHQNLYYFNNPAASTSAVNGGASSSSGIMAQRPIPFTFRSSASQQLMPHSLSSSQKRSYINSEEFKNTSSNSNANNSNNSNANNNGNNNGNRRALMSQASPLSYNGASSGGGGQYLNSLSAVAFNIHNNNVNGSFNAADSSSSASYHGKPPPFPSSHGTTSMTMTTNHLPSHPHPHPFPSHPNLNPNLPLVPPPILTTSNNSTSSLAAATNLQFPPLPQSFNGGNVSGLVGGVMRTTASYASASSITGNSSELDGGVVAGKRTNSLCLNHHQARSGGGMAGIGGIGSSSSSVAIGSLPNSTRVVMNLKGERKQLPSLNRANSSDNFKPQE